MDALIGFGADARVPPVQDVAGCLMWVSPAIGGRDGGAIAPVVIREAAAQRLVDLALGHAGIPASTSACIHKGV
jgi:hypothetical protein